MAKVLVTGASGFIGTHLVSALRNRGDNVYPLSHDNLKDRLGLSIVEKMQDLDYIFHLAAYGNMGNQKDELEIFNANLTKTWNLLQSTKYIPYKAFVNFGTSSEYGHSDHPMSEVDMLKPDTFYAATKASATQLCRAFGKQYNKPIITVRPFSIYGPGEADWRFMPTAIKSMLTKTPMPYVGWPTHDWTYVDDFIDGVILSASHPEEEILNIGTGQATTNDEIIKTLSYIGDKGIVRDGEYSEMPHHSPVWQADITKIKNLGWEPKVTLEEGLKRTYEYYKEKYGK